jgi:hypothetical protein
MMFYPSKNNNRLNAKPFMPEVVTGTAMVNPHYRVQLAPGTRYIIDSGAFQERDMACRLEPWQALERQLKLERWIAYHNGSAYAEALISYDMLDGVDETLTEAGRIKQRGTDVTASRAVQETIRSAHIYRALRDRVAGAIAYACQGVSTAQYLACARQILPLLRSGRDWFAFGGLCITGMQRRTMLPIFQATLEAVFPLLATYGVQRVHILGVCVPEAIRVVQQLEAHYQITCSTDSSAPERAAIFGNTYHQGRQKATYTKAQKLQPGGYHPCDLAHDNILRYAQWLEA